VRVFLCLRETRESSEVEEEEALRDAAPTIGIRARRSEAVVAAWQSPCEMEAGDARRPAAARCRKQPVAVRSR
jgi:hypothetical protein